MTHLRIEQGTNIEIVTSDIIHKLYEIASGIIDYEDANQITTSQVYLKGNIQTSRAYGDEVDWLEAKFPDLHINVTGGRYIRFADPIVESYWANSQYGDGTGILATEAALVTSRLSRYAFGGNTNITSFDELSKFGITDLDLQCFKGCTSLQSIDLSKITVTGRDCFADCSNLDKTNWDLSNITTLGQSCFAGCPKLKGTLNLSGVQTIDLLTTGLFSGCSSLQKIILGHVSSVETSRMNANRSTFYQCNSLKVVDIDQLDSIMFSNNILIDNNVFQAFIIRNTNTIPTITLDQNTNTAWWSNFTSSSNAKIYVDDNLYSTYINHADWSDLASHIEPLSNYVES